MVLERVVGVVATDKVCRAVIYWERMSTRRNVVRGIPPVPRLWSFALNVEVLAIRFTTFIVNS